MADYVLKVCLLGEASVGKTSLVFRLVEGKFSRDFKATLGVNLLKKKMSFDNKEVSIQIWDLGGQASYRKLRKLYLEGSQGALVVFDVTNQASFGALDEWIATLKEVRGSKVPMALIGNKIDLEANRVVSKDQAEAFAKKYNMKLILTSAATGEKVDDAFMELAREIIRQGVTT